MPSAALLAIGGFLKRIPWQAWALLAAALFIGGLVAYGQHWHGEALKSRDQVSLDCAAARKSANNPKMSCDQTDEQIGFLGEAITTLTNAIHKQNSAVAALGTESARQQADSAKASQGADKRAQTPQATSARLEASSRAGERLTKPCEPSKELAGAWR